MNPYDLLGSAAHRKLRAQDELASANRDLASAVRLLHDQGTPKCEMAGAIQDDLLLHGFEPEQVSRLGLSYASIRLMLSRT